MSTDIIEILDPFYFDHTKNQILPDTIVDNRHYSEGAKLIAIFAISPIYMDLKFMILVLCNYIYFCANCWDITSTHSTV
jgi:hypothetical protein